MDLLAWLGGALLALGMLALGLWAGVAERRHGADSEGFWTAHRSLSGWSLGMSLSASMLSVSWSLVYGVELLYRYGWGGLWLLAIPWLVTLGLFYLLVPRLRAFGAFSQGELFGQVYGRKLQLLTALVLSVVFLAWCGAEIAAAGELLAPMLQAPAPLVMAGLSLLVAAYSWAGGFRAVVLTDVAQFLLIAVFLGFLAVRSWQPQGLSPLAPIPAPSLWLVLVTLLVYVTGWLSEADIWLRFTAAKSDTHARLAMAFTAGVSLVLVIGVPALMAAAARGLLPQSQELVFPRLLAHLLPPQLHILVLGGFAAVALSTISTTANVVAVTWARDWPRKKVHNSNLSWARWASALAVFAALVVAWLSRSLSELFYLSAGLLSAGLFWPTLGLFYPCLREAARVAAWVGFFAVLASFLLERSGLFRFAADPGLNELAIGYIPPALAVGVLALAGRWLWMKVKKPRGSLQPTR
jgi:SSS family solute:Na+ symporter